jgi:hypothetical protein
MLGRQRKMARLVKVDQSSQGTGGNIEHNESQV